jgi:hypothetical protein
VPSAHPAGEVANWARSGDGIGLADVVANAEPTMLIGTSTQPAAFTEQIVRQMASKADRPIIMPLSNPTSKCEALPQDLIRWTEGRALVATGSPFPPVTYEGRTYRIAQANNALIFPGLGLGVAVAKASRINEPMLEAAADAVAELSDATTPGAALLPPVENLRMVSAAVGVAVALAAEQEGLAQVELSSPVQQVHQAMWRPDYPRSNPSSSASRTPGLYARRLWLENAGREAHGEQCHAAATRSGGVMDTTPAQTTQATDDRARVAARVRRWRRRRRATACSGTKAWGCARPRGPPISASLAGLLSRPDEPDRGASDEHQRLVLDLPSGAISGCRP